MFTIYLLVSKNKQRSYVGFTSNLKDRIAEHKNKDTKTTKNLGEFSFYKLEEVETIADARAREKHWKSGAGRERLKKFFTENIF